MARLPALAVTSVAASLLLSACQQRAETPAVANAPATASQAAAALATPPAALASANTAPVVYAITITGRIHADLPESRFTLLADGAPQDTHLLHVRAIEIRPAEADVPMQRIDGLATNTPWSASAPGLELLDMNFDGYTDMRLITSQPAGPNVPYLNWLYDPSSERFVENPALDAITAPRFDAAAREVHSDWRDGASRYGTDTYTLREGELLPLRRKEKIYQRAGVFTLEISRWADGAWRKTETREGRDP